MNITTKYKTNSKGTGQVVATAAGRQRTVTYDQAASSVVNHASAAAAVIRAVVAVTPDQTVNAFVRSIDHGYASHTSNDSGTIHKWEV